MIAIVIVTWTGWRDAVDCIRACLALTGPPVRILLCDNASPDGTADLIAHYQTHIAVHSRPFPGALAMLDALDARGVKIALVTNKLEHLAVKLLDALGLSSRFYTILGGDSLGPG